MPEALDPWEAMGISAPKDETRYCKAIMTHGRYAVEECDIPAEEGSDYCKEHRYLEDEGDSEREHDGTLDEDESYDKWREDTRG